MPWPVAVITWAGTIVPVTVLARGPPHCGVNAASVAGTDRGASVVMFVPPYKDWRCEAVDRRRRRKASALADKPRYVANIRPLVAIPSASRDSDEPMSRANQVPGEPAARAVVFTPPRSS